VYIKYSPQANLTNTENQIKRLVQNAVPGLSYDNISVFLQAASYRYQPVSQPSGGDVSQVSRQLAQYKMPLVVGLSGIMLLSLGGMWWMRRKSC
jgi:type III secretion protein J